MSECINRYARMYQHICQNVSTNVGKCINSYARMYQQICQDVWTIMPECILICLTCMYIYICKYIYIYIYICIYRDILCVLFYLLFKYTYVMFLCVPHSYHLRLGSISPAHFPPCWPPCPCPCTVSLQMA